MPLVDDLQNARTEARERADLLVRAAADEERDLTAEEMSQYSDAIGEERQAQDRLEQLRDDQVRELRAAAARTPEERPGLGTMLQRALETRTVTEAGGAGQAFSPAEYANSFFDRLAATAVFLQTGPQVLTTTRDSLSVPHWKTDTAAAWTSEASQINATDPDADSVVATPRKLAGLTYASNESLSDSQPSLYDAIANGLVRSMALEFDRAAFFGSGAAPEIRGLDLVVGTQTVPFGGAWTNLDHIADAIELLLDENANPGALVMSPRAYGDAIRLKEATTSNNKPLLQDSSGSGAQAPARQIYGVPVFVSGTLSYDPNVMFMFDPSQVVVVRRQDVSVETDTSIRFDYDETAIRGIMRIDVAVPNPKSIVVIAGVS